MLVGNVELDVAVLRERRIGKVRNPVSAHAGGGLEVVDLVGAGDLAPSRRAPPGSRSPQAVAAASNRAGLTLPGAPRPGAFWITPLLSGSGNVGTPWERMQREYATGPVCGVVGRSSRLVGGVEEATLATRGRASAATAGREQRERSDRDDRGEDG